MSKLIRLSWQDYVAQPAIHWSTLKQMLKSPAHYLAAEAEGIPDTSSLMFGRAKHCLALEPKKFEEGFAVWRDGDRRAKGYKAFEEAAAPRDVLTLSEFSDCEAAALAVRESKLAAPYLAEGEAELSVSWEVDGLPAKCRVDFLSSSKPALVDLKFTKDASPEGFPRQVLNYGYAGQAAFYVDAVKHALGEELPFVFIACEGSFPPVVFTVPPDILDLGRSMYRRALKKLAEWTPKPRSEWPGYATEEVVLQLPPYAFTQGDPQ